MGSSTTRLSLLIESQTRGQRELDRLSNQLNRVTTLAEQTQRRTSRGAEEATKNVSRLGNTLEQDVLNPLQAARQRALEFAQSLGTVGRAGAGVVLAVGAISVAAVRMVRQLGDAAKQLSDFADRTGLSIGQVDRLQAAARIAGVGLQSLEQSAVRVAQAISGIGEEGRRSRAAMEALGVEFETASGEARDQGEVLFDLLQALSRVEDGSRRLALGNEALGEGFRQVLPLVLQFGELTREVGEFGFGQDPVLLRQLAETEERFIRIELIGEQVRRSLSRQILVPIDVVLRVLQQGGAPGIGAITGGILGTIGGPVGALGGAGLGALQNLFTRPLATPVPGGPRRVDLTPEGIAQRQAGFAFRRRFAQTPEAQRARLADITTRRRALALELRDTGLTLEIRRERQTEFDALEAERQGILRNIQAAQAATQAAERFAEERAKLTEAIFRIQRASVPRIAGQVAGRNVPVVRRGPSAPTLESLTQQGIVSDVELGLVQAGLGRGRLGPARGAGLGDFLAGQEAANQRQLQILERQLDLQTRRVELMTGPGGEVQAIERITQLRLEGLRSAALLGQDLLDIELQRQEILEDREVRLHQLRMNQLFEYRAAVVGAFQALIGGGRSGVSAFLRSQGLGVLSQVVGNLATESFGSLGALGIPGRGTAQQPSFLGRLLRGTPFGLQAAAAVPGIAALVGGGGGGTSLVQALNQEQFSAASAAGQAQFGVQTAGLVGRLTGALGPVAGALPFVGGGLAAFSLISSLLPDPRAERAREIDLQIETARIQIAGPAEFNFAGTAGFDRDFTGAVRPVSETQDFERVITSGEVTEATRRQVLGDF